MIQVLKDVRRTLLHVGQLVLTLLLENRNLLISISIESLDHTRRLCSSIGSKLSTFSSMVSVSLVPMF